MFKLVDFKNRTCFADGVDSPFIKEIKSNWNRIHSEPNIFRYEVNKLQERIIHGKYLLQLNPDRGTNRRTPENITNIQQPFDSSQFNFNKVSQKEIMFSVDFKENEHILLVNVSPISQYHTLICPMINKNLPQVVTADSLALVLEIMFTVQDRNLKIGFNSLCALASVNHLHYHLLIEKHTLAVELVKWKQISGPLHYTEEYPVPAFCFEVHKDIVNTHKEIFKLVQYFLEKSIAHNILFVMRSTMDVAVYIWPRKTTAGVKQLMDFNVAVLELSGWFPVYSAEAFERLTAEDLENELMKWRIDHFEKLCKDVALLY